jgi:hypothetical protein
MGRGDVQAWWSLIADVGFRLVSSRQKRKRKREREREREREETKLKSGIFLVFQNERGSKHKTKI